MAIERHTHKILKYILYASFEKKATNPKAQKQDNSNKITKVVFNHLYPKVGVLFKSLIDFSKRPIVRYERIIKVKV